MTYDLTLLIPTLATIVVTIVLATRANRESTMKAINEWRMETRADQAAMKVSIDNLKASVDKHNHFAERMPVIEQQVADLKANDEEIFVRLRAVENRGGTQ